MDDSVGCYNLGEFYRLLSLKGVTLFPDNNYYVEPSDLQDIIFIYLIGLCISVLNLLFIFKK